ncbi:hypothetical protein B0H11DRAFT_2051055, partial [Mycena galericulata]
MTLNAAPTISKQIMLRKDCWWKRGTLGWYATTPLPENSGSKQIRTRSVLCTGEHVLCLVDIFSTAHLNRGPNRLHVSGTMGNVPRKQAIVLPSGGIRIQHTAFHRRHGPLDSAGRPHSLLSKAEKIPRTVGFCLLHEFFRFLDFGLELAELGRRVLKVKGMDYSEANEDYEHD